MQDDVEAWNIAEGPHDRDAAIEDMGEGYLPLYKYAISVINGGEDNLCPAVKSRKALELVLAIYKSAAEGRPVKCPMEKCSTMEFCGRF